LDQLAIQDNLQIRTDEDIELESAHHSNNSHTTEIQFICKNEIKIGIENRVHKGLGEIVNIDNNTTINNTTINSFDNNNSLNFSLVTMDIPNKDNKNSKK